MANKKWNESNLKEYVEKNSDCSFINFKYSKSGHIILEIKCSCGSIFETQKKHFDNGKTKCNKCNGIKRYDLNSLNNIVEELSNCKFLNYRSTEKEIILELKCECGNVFYTSLSYFKKGKVICNDCNGKYHRYDVSLLEYYPEILKLWDFSKNDKIGINIYDVSPMSNKKVWIKCQKGVHESSFKSINQITNGRGGCSFCNLEMRESHLANNLKRFCKYVFKDTVLEAKIGCISEKNRDMPFDIYIPSLNILVELQSEYHDNEEQRDRDAIKRNFAIKKGYVYYEFDCRDYDVYDVIEIMFNNSKYDNDYIDYCINQIKTNTIMLWDIDKAQRLINDTLLTYGEIAEILGTTKSAITNAVATKKIENNRTKRSNKNNKNKRPVIQYSKDNVYINEYPSIAEASRKTNTSEDSIHFCCKGKSSVGGDFIWRYK